MLRRALVAAVALALAAPAAASAQTADDEPNGDVRQASGPLAGGAVHTGSLTGSADRDWFVFYSSGAGELNVGIANTSGGDTCTLLTAAVLDSDADAIFSFSLAADDARDVPVTANGHERYYVRIDGERGCTPRDASYRILIEGPVTTDAPAGLRPPPCQDARDRLAAAQKALRRARGAKRRRAAKRRVAAARRAVAKGC
ncbi:MAG TPA: hypothetical protein VF529_06610 [Solirubrobacteraceae bacterium]|jgi:hypothetical protein